MAKIPGKPTESAESQPENAAEQSIEAELERQLAPVLSNMSNVQRGQILGKVVQIVRSEHYSGPLPHPRHLQEYNNVVPNGADRIIAMAERQLAHDMEIQSKIVNCEIRDRHIGMGLGFLSFTALVVMAYWAGMAGNNMLAGLLLSAAAIGGVAAFIKGRFK